MKSFVRIDHDDIDPDECAFDHPTYIGDEYCDDGPNTPECHFDGGDCCGADVKTEYCQACECLDPSNVFQKKKKKKNSLFFKRIFLPALSFRATRVYLLLCCSCS
jgi:hypothetical protein